MKSLIMRDRKTGEPVSIPIYLIPEVLHPTVWRDYIDWRYRDDKDSLQGLIEIYLKKEPMHREEVMELAEYIVDYACHIGVAAWLLCGPEEKDSILKFNKEGIEKLREVHKRAKTREDITEMINIGLDYAFDPL